MKHIKTKKSLGKRIGIIAAWVGGSLVALVAVAALCLVLLLNTDILPDLRDQYVLMTYHTSNPWLCTAFAPAETIERILHENRVEQPDENTDTGLIQIPGATTTAPENPGTTLPSETTTTTTTRPTLATTQPIENEDYRGTVIYEEPGLQILEIKTKYFTARMVMVADPTRVSLGVTDRYGKFGEKLVNMCNRTDALVGVNAGGFQDPNGSGNGGTPTYLLVKDHELKYWDKNYSKQNIIGLSDTGVLMLGTYTKAEVEQLAAEGGLKDATSFKPFLIVNGEMATFSKAAGGRDPRTAIGQRADGTLLLLTADGRQAGMEGANQRDMANIMQTYGAVNAANLDGGSSTTMVLNGKIINKPCSLYGPRYLNTAWLVSKLPSAAAALPEEE